ncbi:Negative regulator of mitotic exit [Dispira simplex]|nr:Negative regulator of mitotic exit [Dispira simplex]
MTHASDSYQPYISREQLTFSLHLESLQSRRLWWLLWLALLPGGKGQDLVGRFFHQTVMANNKLYVIGGQQNVGHARYNFCNKSLTLDLNASFNVYNPPWRNDDVTTVNMFLTARHSLSLVTSLDHQSQLLMYGGDTPRGRQMSGPLWSYIPEDDSWVVVKANRTLPWRSGHTAVTDTLRNRVYFYGGQVQGASSISYYIDNTVFSVLDVSAQQWLSTSQEFFTTGTNPGARENHGAVLLNHTHFLLLGGLTTTRQPADARTIYLFDIPSQRWSYRSTRGAIPSRLSSFTLNVYKNMLIIYGGRANDGTSDYYDQFLTLDTRQTTGPGKGKLRKMPHRVDTDTTLFYSTSIF